MPVSGLAAGAYLAMLVASLSIGPATAAAVRRLAWGAMLVLAGAVAGSAVWFIIVQKWVIGAFCPYCTATHITGLLLAVLVIWRGPRKFENDSIDVALTNPAGTPDVRAAASTARYPTTGAVIAAQVRVVSLAAAWGIIGSLPAVGLALACILAACQVGFTPPAVYHGGESQNNPPFVDPQDVPLVGSPAALYVVALLFDYKCPHCQQIHFMLNDSIRRYEGKLAFALCPAPLNTQCNPYIPKDVDEFKDSCELAKVALAVFLAEPEAFAAFDGWMFSFESGDRWHPRSLDAARTKAIELVGQAKFDAARANPWIDRYMQTSIRIYGKTGGNAIPKLVFGSRWVIPEPNNAEDLVFILHHSLGVPEP